MIRGNADKTRTGARRGGLFCSRGRRDDGISDHLILVLSDGEESVDELQQYRVLAISISGSFW